MAESLAISAEIRDALAEGLPVVALETTLVTHGLPHPRGVEVGLELERIVRQEGAVPATIAILDGKARVGIDGDALEQLVEAGASKVNLGNLAAVLASGGAGSTTVAATMAIAHRAGLRILATGGIGGVHRNYLETGDVSADLIALARYPLAVVCAGAKALLDLPRTVQALETAGVPVLGFGTSSFPAFYRRASGLPVDRRCDSVAEAGRIASTHFGFSRQATGVLVANPIPEKAEMARNLYEEALTRAMADLESASVRGRAVTPFLLSRLDRYTTGASVRANRALLESNARLAARLAPTLV